MTAAEMPHAVTATIDGWLREASANDADAAWLLCDRHDPDDHAFTFVSADLSARVVTYGELAGRSRRMATVLQSLGVERGHRIAVLMGKRLEPVVSLLAKLTERVSADDMLTVRLRNAGPAIPRTRRRR